MCLLVCWNALSALVAFSLQDESSSHVLLIPFVSLYLIYAERSRIFRIVRTSAVSGGATILAAIVLYLFVASHTSLRTSRTIFAQCNARDRLVLARWILVVLWDDAARAGAFALLFLLLMIPLPPALLARIIYFLQRGSTAVAYLLFRAVGVPVLRQGFVLSVPGVSIEVAKECSGIRSSMALFITCLLAAHLFLRTSWKKLLFVLLALPLAIVKNGIRITTLTLLSIYVDPGFLHGSLHRDGGFVFFFLALAILAPILILLQKSEGVSLIRQPLGPAEAERAVTQR